MGKQAGAIRDAWKAVEQPGIAHVDFRRLQLPFAAVGVPGLQTANPVGAAEKSEIMARGGLRSTEGASELGAVPDLAMKMGDHRPEARSVSAAVRTPSCGRSCSRKVRRQSLRQRALAVSVVAKNERGNPPRSQSASRAFGATSARLSPPRSTKPTRPARLAATPRTIVGEALPRTRKRAGAPRRSASGRKAAKSPGSRWTSSMTTSPRNGDRASSGWRSAARSPSPQGRTSARRVRPKIPGRACSCRTGAAPATRPRDSSLARS